MSSVQKHLDLLLYQTNLPDDKDDISVDHLYEKDTVKKMPNNDVSVDHLYEKNINNTPSRRYVGDSIQMI
jgi:hypothetical protein